jgi:hypothetical protein
MFALAEGKRVGLSAWAEERDLEGSVGYRARLPDELVESLFGQRPVAFVIDVGPVRRTGWLSVDTHVECRGGARCGGAHDEVEAS